MTNPKGAYSVSTPIEHRIHLVRNQRVVLAPDLAQLYGVPTKRLNEQVKRNRERFPNDFMFQMSDQEVSNLRSQIATSSWGGTRARPYAFTEHGVVMAANVLSSPLAIQSSILIVRAFLRLRQMVLEHGDLKRRLEMLESKLAKGFHAHEQELLEIRFLIAQLEKPIDIKKRRLGF